MKLEIELLAKAVSGGRHFSNLAGNADYKIEPGGFQQNALQRFAGIGAAPLLMLAVAVGLLVGLRLPAAAPASSTAWAVGRSGVLNTWRTCMGISLRGAEHAPSHGKPCTGAVRHA